MASPRGSAYFLDTFLRIPLSSKMVLFDLAGGGSASEYPTVLKKLYTNEWINCGFNTSWELYFVLMLILT